METEKMDAPVPENTHTQKRNYIFLTLALFLAFAFFGFSDTVRSTALPRIQDDMNLLEWHLGLLLAVTSIGYLLACSFTARFARRIGIKACLICALSIQFCSGALIFLSPNYASLIAAFFVLNFGNGMLDISTSVIAAKTFTTRTGAMMNLAHFFYGVGMILSPVVSVRLMMASFGDGMLGWRYAYLIILGFAVVPAIPALLGKLTKQDSDKKKTGYRAMLRKPTIWLALLLLAFGSSAEMGLVVWFANFLERAYSFTAERAADYLMWYFICFALTRLLIGPLIDKIGLLNSLSIATALAGILIISGALLGEQGSILLIVAGIGIAPIWPTAMAVIAKLFKDEIDLAMTTIMTTMGIIMVPGSYMIGGIINQARVIFTRSHGDAGVGMAFTVGFLFIGLCCFGACLFALILKSRQKMEGKTI